MYSVAVMKYFNDEEYSDFSRGIGRWLTLDEMSDLPRVINAEVLVIVAKNGSVIGLIVLREFPKDVITMGMVIDKEQQNKGYGHTALKDIERYIFQVRNARICLVETLSRNDKLGLVMKERGYSKCGEIPNYHIVNGFYQNVMIYYKEARGG